MISRLLRRSSGSQVAKMCWTWCGWSTSKGFAVGSGSTLAPSKIGRRLSGPRRPASAMARLPSALVNAAKRRRSAAAFFGSPAAAAEGSHV